MKVIEKGTDRKAEVHFYVRGRVPPVEEYGEYVDPVDNAICCFVPVEEGQKIHVDGKFRGTTLTIQSDIIVDGICRMTLSFSGKHVACQKSKNLGADTYLFTTIDGVVESSLVVEALPSATVLQEDAKAIVGTIEMRVYVLRRFGDHHMPQDLPKYHESVWKGTRRKADDPVGYTTIEPDFVLTAEEDLAAIETRLANKYRKAMDGARPGLEPWAIFRFHYRRKQAILDAKYKQTFSTTWKKKPEARTLQIEQLNLLEIGTKPPQLGDNDDTSTRYGSQTPSMRGTPAPKSHPLSSQPSFQTPAPRPATKIMESIEREGSPDTLFVSEEPEKGMSASKLFREEVEEMGPLVAQTQNEQEKEKDVTTANEGHGEPETVTVNNTKIVDTTETEKNTIIVEDISTSGDGVVGTAIDSAFMTSNLRIVKMEPQETTESTNNGPVAAEKEKRPVTPTTTKEHTIIPLKEPLKRATPAPMDITKDTSTPTGPLTPMTPTKRFTASALPDTPTPKRVKLPSASVEPGNEPLNPTINEKKRKIAEIRKQRAEIAQKRKELDAKLDEILAKEKAERDREAQEYEEELELLGQYEGVGME